MDRASQNQIATRRRFGVTGALAGVLAGAAAATLALAG